MSSGKKSKRSSLERDSMLVDNNSSISMSSTGGGGLDKSINSNAKRQIATVSSNGTVLLDSDITELDEGVDGLHFEDPFEDEVDSDDERVLKAVEEKEAKKYQAKQNRQIKQLHNSNNKMNIEQQDEIQNPENENELDGQEEDDENLGDATIDKEEEEGEEEEEEEEDDDDDNVDEEEEEEGSGKKKEKKKKSAAKYVWRPSDGMSESEQLDYDSTAYSMLHRMTTDWPCLSFDIIRDTLGASRQKAPHTMFLAAGTQADSSNKNSLIIMKISPLHKTKHDDESDEDDDSDDEQMKNKEKKPTDPNKSTGDEDEVDADLDDDPLVEERRIPHIGGVNRIRLSPTHPHLLATWADTGKVHIFDISSTLTSLDQSFKSSISSTISLSSSTNPKQRTAPIFTFSGHSSEGFAMAWSQRVPGRMVTGDCEKHIYLWEMQQGQGQGAGVSSLSWKVNNQSFVGHTNSVEDLVWSPSEDSVFASCSSDKTIRMWDVRVHNRCAAWVAAHKSDVNVISWNNRVQQLLASGADDGQIKVWDLRKFKSDSPAACFRWHSKPITSIEWHPSEDSILAASSADDSISVWDLALEADIEEMQERGTGATLTESIPAQLFFVHAGQKEIKEIHWHNQIPSLLVSTALDGFNIFKPENLE